MNNEIQNIEVYNDRMAKTLIDKIFFIDKVDADVFIDFGCADGTVLSYLHDLFPNNYYVGYDINPDMITIAEEKNKDRNIKFFSTMDDIKKYLSNFDSQHKVCLILNSVIHEIYSYSSYEQIEEFYDFAFSGLFNYIAIRDMMPNQSINRPADITDIARVRAFANQSQLSEFEDIFGSIDNNKNLIHFLLKYKYIENWNRECRENYFPITTQQFVKRIPKNYCIDYYTEFLLPYAKRTIYEDFQINVKDTTHLKIILRKY
jgi:SAM-dependent methyltransferase